MDELKLNDARNPLRTGSKAWVEAEVRRFRDLSAKHGGLTTPWFAKTLLGVSRQRVYQLMDTGHLPSFELLGKKFIACDQLEAFSAVERNPQTRYSGEIQAA